MEERRKKKRNRLLVPNKPVSIREAEAPLVLRRTYLAVFRFVNQTFPLRRLGSVSPTSPVEIQEIK
jgi:hypothetical protein